MTTNSRVIYSVSEHFIAENPVIPFVLKLSEFREELTKHTLDFDGQLIPLTGKLTCAPEPALGANGYKWQWLARPGKGPNLAQYVEGKKANVRARGAVAGQTGGIGWEPLSFDAEPGRLALLLDDVLLRYHPCAFGFIRGFREAGIPMFRMHGFSVGPTWGELVVYVDWDAAMGPELVFKWSGDEWYGDPSPELGYAGEWALQACYDHAELRTGVRGEPYRFTPSGVEKRK